MNTILLAILVLGGLGLSFGLGLSYVDKKFKVEEDSRFKEIMGVLPNVNCGGCGFPGCANFANALLTGEGRPEGCPPGGFKVAEAIGKIMGVEVRKTSRRVAFIRCSGGLTKSNFRYRYEGMNNCSAAIQLAAGGAKVCSYGCLGIGSCISVCEFDAISIVDGISKVDDDKCIACGKCVTLCPKNLIEMVPYDKKVRVACDAHESGKNVRVNCKAGCITCRMCEKECKYGAINVYHELAEVDYDKCTQCMACVGKCPPKSIVVR